MTESFSFRDPSGECPMRSEVDHQIQKTLQLDPRSRPKSRVRNLEPDPAIMAVWPSLQRMTPVSKKKQAEKKQGFTKVYEH